VRGARKEALIGLLLEARRFDNETVRSADAVAAWRRRMDEALDGAEGDRPEDRYDTPARREHRAFVRGMFRRVG